MRHGPCFSDQGSYIYIVIGSFGLMSSFKFLTPDGRSDMPVAEVVVVLSGNVRITVPNHTDLLLYTNKVSWTVFTKQNKSVLHVQKCSHLKSAILALD